ncbi:transketolase [Novosphingobium sp.]|uniref:transketolase n=1 Tax=Novosphingobium sp. TaxID=1874826 RepID=UPI003D0F1954
MSDQAAAILTGHAPAATTTSDIDMLAINTIRTLAMDAVQQAESGHPGTPMALAPVAYTLWQSVLRYDPKTPLWPNRDRFVLSNGHASMLQYGLIHLAGVRDSKDADRAAITLDDIKAFRQLDSRCPGHPEHGITTGVEVTTGPLGQGCANSVGMAMAGKWLANHFNKPDATLFDYDVYTFCGDGDMMEGVASEAASIAGHLQLGNLCWIYDNNSITIEGHTSLAFNEDVAARFRAYGWRTEHVPDANDTEALKAAYAKFKSERGAPLLIVVDSHIGFGSPHKQDSEKAHGEALGEDEVRLTKAVYGWPEDAKFLVPDGVMAHFNQGIGARGAQLCGDWEKTLETYRSAHPDEAAQFDAFLNGEAPADWDKALPAYPADAKGEATRAVGGKVINALAQAYPWLIGGAADLSPSTKTNMTFDGAGSFEAETTGRNLHFGIREHAMGAIVNGMTLTGLRAYGSTFLIFSDYMKPPIRLAALMEQPSIFIYTHDSIGLGEDGPTHQPVEQLLSLRSVPGLITLRPGDANEVVEAYKVVAQLRHNPAAIALTRQAIRTYDREVYAPAAWLAKGAYVMADAKDGTPDLILIGTGSELALAVGAYETLKDEGVAVRVVSMPSWELFEQQSDAYRESVLPRAVTARVTVEAGTVIGWDRYAGPTGTIIGMHTFGASAPIKDLMAKFGFTPEAVLAAARKQLAQANSSATEITA